MKFFITLVITCTLIGISTSCTKKDSSAKVKAHQTSLRSDQNSKSLQEDRMKNYEVKKTKAEWKKLLSFNEYRVLRNGGTEIPFVNKYYNNKKEGVYYCRACGKPIFSSRTKYESGTGWPSFWKPIKPASINTKKDENLFMTRTEVVCSRCGSHLGHVFKDGPQPTGLRYCLNSTALHFVKTDLSSTDLKDLSVREKNNNQSD